MASKASLSKLVAHLLCAEQPVVETPTYILLELPAFATCCPLFSVFIMILLTNKQHFHAFIVRNTFNISPRDNVLSFVLKVVVSICISSPVLSLEKKN